MKSMNRYQTLSESNILKPVLQRIQAGAFKIATDHKIHLDASIVPERPWLTHLADPERKCGKWHEVYFRYYSIIPKGCRNCWKIMFKPDTVTEVFQLRDLQRSMSISSKCGVETRGFTGNKSGYAGFWYVPLDAGLKGAREMHSLIDTKIQARFRRESKRVVNLKRGCTEMENYTFRFLNVGSNKWDEIATKMNMDAKEMLLDTIFVDPEIIDTVPTFCDVHTEQLFLDFAYENGDLTYLEHTGGIPHMPSPVFYEDNKYKHQDFKSSWRNHNVLNIDRPDNAKDGSQGAGGPLIQTIP
jgi:hypothetical protein